MDYATLKTVHVSCAMLSIAGFVARGALMPGDSPLLRARFVRIAPHVVDTVLLGSALLLAWRSDQYPFVQSWLTAKVVALFVYIALGGVAFSRKCTPGVRTAAFVAALLAFGYIVSVAMLRIPAGAFSFLR